MRHSQAAHLELYLSKYSWVMIILWLSLPLVFFKWSYGLHIMIMVAIYVLLTQSLNLILGLANQLQLGHAANFGIGAYVAALLMVNWGIPFWYTLPLSFLVPGLVGLIVGLPTLRGVGGDYLGIVTLGFGEIARILLINMEGITRGPMGIPGIPPPAIFGFEFATKTSFFYLATILAAFAWFVLNRITNSKLGLQFMAVGMDENCAQVLGVNTGIIKLIAFSISAAFAGLGGAFYASYFSFVSPDSFMFIDSLAVLCMLIVGGKGNLVGCMIGAVILGIAPELFRFLGDYRMLIYGVLLTFMVIYRPQGIWGLDKRRLNKIVLRVE
jgi:branched-chain amino acid transport system permease protein